jgi:ATP-dependent RNA helicase DDX31/DBP7
LLFALCRVGRTARLGQEGESFLFLQPNEIDYLDLLGKRHVAVQPLPLMNILDEIPLDRRKVRTKEMLIPEVHPGVLALENRLEAMLGRQVQEASF